MIFQMVYNLLAQITGCDEARMSMKTVTLEDVEATVDDFHELISELEVEFEVPFDNLDYDAGITIGDLVRYLEVNI